MQYFQGMGFARLVIYNDHISTANAYDRMLGVEVVKTESQHPGGMPLETDVFGCHVETVDAYP